jgi:alkaline phosphatase
MTGLRSHRVRGTAYGVRRTRALGTPHAPYPVPRARVGARLTIALLLTLAQRAEAQRRVILFIGDGVGTAYWTAARLASDSLNVRQFKTMGLVDTRSSSSPITDSGAGATAYSTGVRTFNLAIGVGPDSQPRETVLEAAKKMGLATGIVVTSSVTDATPGSFVSHVVNRSMQFDIAKQMTALAPDVILGSGMRYFDPAVRPDRSDLLATLRMTHTVVTDAASFSIVRDSATTKLVGLFGPQDMMPAARRDPTLSSMTQKAINILSRDPDGFFLMVEGSQPDWRGHNNLPIGTVVDEMLDFDAAIGVALAYQRRVPDVLIVVVADHETGGLAIETARDTTVLTGAASDLTTAARSLNNATALMTRQAADSAQAVISGMLIAAARMQTTARTARTERITADYTTGGHTGQMVPLFASGPGAEAFGGMLDNYRIGQMLMEIVKRPAPPRRRR